MHKLKSSLKSFQEDDKIISCNIMHTYVCILRTYVCMYVYPYKNTWVLGTIVRKWILLYRCIWEKSSSILTKYTSVHILGFYVHMYVYPALETHSFYTVQICNTDFDTIKN